MGQSLFKIAKDVSFSKLHLLYFFLLGDIKVLVYLSDLVLLHYLEHVVFKKRIVFRTIDLVNTFDDNLIRILRIDIKTSHQLGLEIEILRNYDVIFNLKLWALSYLFSIRVVLS